MWPILAAAEQGRPLTARDLSGKKICWNGSLDVTYQADGETLENRFGHLRHSMWSVPEPGLVRFGPAPGTPEWSNFSHYNYRPMVVLPDGSFHVQRFRGQSGGSLTSADLYIDSWGSVCR
jgi:hypothetical protein